MYIVWNDMIASDYLTENISLFVYFHIVYDTYMLNSSLNFNLSLNKCVAYHKYTFIARAKKKIRWNQNGGKNLFHILDNNIHTFFHNRKNLNDFCVIINFQTVCACECLSFLTCSHRLNKKNCELILLLSVVYILIDQFIIRRKKYELMWSDAIKSTRQKGDYRKESKSA